MCIICGEIAYVLDKSNPGFLKILEKRREDMEKPDHSIVIAGKMLYEIIPP